MLWDYSSRGSFFASSFLFCTYCKYSSLSSVNVSSLIGCSPMDRNSSNRSFVSSKFLSNIFRLALISWTGKCCKRKSAICLVYMENGKIKIIFGKQSFKTNTNLWELNSLQEWIRFPWIFHIAFIPLQSICQILYGFADIAIFKYNSVSKQKITFINQVAACTEHLDIFRQIQSDFIWWDLWKGKIMNGRQQ